MVPKGRLGARSIDHASQSDEKSIAIKSNALVNRLKADSFANRNEDAADQEFQEITRKRLVKYSNSFRGKKIGRYNVICGGACMLPPQFYLSLISLVITIGPSLFQVFYNNRNYREYMNTVKGEETSTIGVDIAYLITMTLSVIFLLKTSMTEPGIIPREHDPLSEILKNVPYAHKQMILKQENKRKFFISKSKLHRANSK